MIRIQYDDDALAILDKVNAELRGHSLMFDYETGPGGDGWIGAELKKTDDCTPTLDHGQSPERGDA